jgi:hypothetical protein
VRRPSFERFTVGALRKTLGEVLPDDAPTYVALETPEGLLYAPLRFVGTRAPHKTGEVALDLRGWGAV